MRRTICLRWSRTGAAVSRWCWCMALPPAPSVGQTWSTTCWRTRRSGITTSSGSSPTTPATPSRSQPMCCVGRWRTPSKPSAVQADPALGHMVVIGHSQGGLLTKMIAIESGTKIWDAISSRPVDALNLKPETKVLLKETLFVHPLPFVETVIFIATPHGGSYQASMTIVGLFRRLVTLPMSIVTATTDILTNAGNALKLAKDRRTFNSLAGMSPGNPAIEALRAIPVAPGIHAHSIIPTLQDGPLETRDDGVVEYKSAHIDGVDSELVIEHQDHSAQSNPLTVREVRRILIEQLARPSL